MDLIFFTAEKRARRDTQRICIISALTQRSPVLCGE